MRTSYQSDRVLNTYRGTSMTAPATMYGGIITAITDAEAGTVTEASYAGYARKAVAFGAPAGGGGGRQILNNALVLFDAKTDAGQVVGIGIGLWDAISAGNLTDIIPNDGADPIIVMAMPGDLATDLLSSPAHGLVVDNQVRFEAFPGASGLPTGLSENTTYWVISTGLTADQFKVSTTQGGGAVNITAVGRSLLMKITTVPINQNDQPQFQNGVLKLVDD
jgi:hypothetical protein